MRLNNTCAIALNLVFFFFHYLCSIMKTRNILISELSVRLDICIYRLDAGYFDSECSSTYTIRLSLKFEN